MVLACILPPQQLGTLCPVCGFDLGFPAWDAGVPSGKTCPSCGIRFGQDDNHPNYRRDFIYYH